MYGGEVVEEGPTENLLADPRHPYTWALINAVPASTKQVRDNRRLTTIEGSRRIPSTTPRLPLRPALPVPDREV